MIQKKLVRNLEVAYLAVVLGNDIAITKAEAIGRSDDNVFIDILGCINDLNTYPIYKDEIEFRKAIDDKKLKSGDVFCFSVMNAKSTFKGLPNTNNIQKLISFFKEYNSREFAHHYFTFLDDQEVETLNKKPTADFMI